jgi:hypothetical protein
MKPRKLSILGLAAALTACLMVAGCAKTGTDENATSQNQGQSEGRTGSRGSKTPARPTTIDVTIPSGTSLAVVINEGLSSKTNHAGDTFDASLASPVESGGHVVFPKDARVTGTVVNAVASGHLKTPAVLSITLNSIEANGTTYNISTRDISMSAKSHKGRDIAFIGGGSGLGALIGGLAGGGKGALIGGLAGAGAGTAGAYLTGKKDVAVRPEARMSFALTAPVTAKIPNTPAATPSAGQ